MSRARFATLVTVLTLAVGAGSFALGLQVLDDGRPDPPPRGGSAAVTTVPLTDAGPTTAPPPTSPPASAPDGKLVTPTWVTVVASEGSEAAAQAKAEPIAAKGHPAGVLHSDDYGSLRPGLWVAYAGPYPDANAAEDAVDALASDGFNGTYVRCVGSAEECAAGDRADGDGDDGGGDTERGD